MSDEIIEISIGRNSKKPIQIRIKHPTVSEEHALARVSNSKIELIDLNSTNGTFVNNRRIQKSNFCKDDKVRFGKIEIEGLKLYNLLHDRYSKFRMDYSSEFRNILPLLEEFQEKKDKLKKRPIIPIVIRVVTALIMIVALLYINIPGEYRYPLIVVIGLISTLGSFLGKSNITTAKQFDSLKLEYENKLLCPRKSCSYRLINESLTYWLGRKTCPKCEAIYSRP